MLVSAQKLRFATHAMAIAQTLLWASLYYSFPALLLTWQSQLNWSLADLSLAFTLALVMSAICSPLIGRLIDQGLGAKVLALSAAAGGLGLLLLGQVQQLWQFYVVWAFIGCASAGCLYEPCFAFLTRYTGANAKSAITKVTLYAGFAGTISFPACFYLVSHFSWPFTVSTLGFVVLFVALPLLWFSSVSIQKANKAGFNKDNHKASTSASGRLKTLSFWLIAIAFSLSALNHTLVVNYLLPAMHALNFSPNKAVLVMSMIGPMQVIGRIVMMSVDRRLSNPMIAMLCFISMFSAATLMWWLAQWQIVIWGVVVLQGAAYGVTSIMRPVLTKQLLGSENFGAISGYLAVPYLLATASAPFLGAFVWQLHQQQAIFAVINLSALLGLVAMAACYFQHTATTNSYQKLTAKPR
ncbi:MFS transporter [Agarivorans sp. 1_MG-2023]|uniref:MFS transporter n=1 Tax=Agarivorans sp. 1_MG-2023 TaxID=3062634 RepID=UPI0026E14320|nr:MFS transporter [Agarivorans sp. 1_MG-2023]MDO6765133.1 MFS transporter [Agarivorans sp. 1_MG-2023]